MVDKCSKCGLDMDMVGRAHNCRPIPRFNLAVQVATLGADSLLPPDKPKKNLGHPDGTGKSAKRVQSPPDPPKAKVIPAGAKRGRPLNKDRYLSLAATKPWETEGMSRATWFNRRKKSNV